MIDSNLNPENSSAQSEPKKSFEPLQTYHLSHDLRGPLNSVLGFTELLLEGIEGPLSDLQMEDVSAIRQSAQKLLKLINTVVDLGKVDAGKMGLNLSPTNLGQTLNTLIATHPEIRASSVECALNLPEEFPAVWADGNRVAQIVDGLIVYVLPKKGVEKIEISISHDNIKAAINLTVSGLVLPPEKLDMLFDLSVEVDRTGRSKLTEGGLFAPLAYKLAQQQQGQIKAVPTGATETTFVLKLPLYRPE